MVRKKRLSIFLTVVMVCCIVFGGCGSEGDSTSKKDNSTAKSSSEATSQKEDKADTSSEEKKEESPKESSEKEEIDAQDKIYGVGDTIDDDGLKVTFKKIYTKKKGKYTRPEKGNIFLIIDIAVKNDSEDDASVDFTNFDAYADDTEVEINYMDHDLGVKTLDASLSSGKKATGSLTFEVPKSFKKLSLEFKPNPFLDDKYIFEYTK